MLSFLRLLPLAICLLMALAFLLFGGGVDAEGLASRAPENALLTAAFFLIVYGVKSLSVFFPALVLQLAVGFLFSPGAAVLVNVAGSVVDILLPYWVGKTSGVELVYRLRDRYPRLQRAMEMQGENAFFLSFFLRIISCLPGDAVSMYLGAIGLPLGKYYWGSLLGVLPRVILATLMGASITNPSSPMFFLSAGMTVLLSLLSFCGYALYQRKRGKQS